ncbi:molecular chaperone [Raphidocelis subcapitata]|uniref:Molecular chaperone n=1 Tax=Raphidocelis subcapitata TaxID=307507 RepID=A0A2V0NP23_9CHLO|nr:molecular chaperone [Raphidocelis subcapitata]|eukprot:GBF89344.1 molecular chaperone [Raphidocelis subcapitata]
MAATAAAYATLGLSPTATNDEVKEAFRKLVWQHHPDKSPEHQRAAAEVKFKEVKAAYESILRRHAGYAVPPPGAPPNPKYAEAYWHANSVDGRVPWGKFGGYETEMGFYRAAMKGGRNSLLVLTLTGLVAIPIITTVVMMLQGSDGAQWGSFKEAGLDSLREAHRVNGQITFNSPFAARDSLDTQAMRRRSSGGGGGGGGGGSSGAAQQ